MMHLLYLIASSHYRSKNLKKIVMTNATNSVARVAAAVAGLGLVAMSFAPLAGAQTTTTTTTSTTTSATFARNLTIGSHGTDVTALQTWLIGKGFTIAAGATGYFGAQTKAALAAYQAANGISPAVGYFGPITRASVAAGGSSTTTTGLPAGCSSTAGFSPTTGVSCSSSTTTTTTTGPLSGGEGSLNNFKIVGATNSSLNAADSDTVYGFEFRATGSDLQVNRVDYDVSLTNNVSGSASPRPWNVFDGAKLMRNNTVVASLSASDMNNWSQDGTASNGNQIYRLRFDNIKDVVKQDTTADYYLVLSTQGVINSSNNGNIYNVFLTSQGVRAVDAKGINEYSSSSNQSTATVSVSTNTSGSLTLSTGSDNPQATTVQASTNNSTADVTLTTFSLQAKDGDVTVYTIPTSIATTTGATGTGNASDIVRTIKLYSGSTLLDTESYAVGSASTSVKFKNLNVKISQGSTQNFTVKADINSVGSNNTVGEGASVAVSIPSNGWDVVNSAGSNVTITGSVTGNAITFRSIGLAIDGTPSSTSASASAVGTGGTQQGNFTYTFNVTAFGQDIYFAKSAATTIVGQVFDASSVATTTATSSALTSTADTSSGNAANYVVHSGQTKQVTVTVTVPAGSNASVYSRLNSFKFGLSDGAPSASTAPFTNNYQTAPVYLHS
jgi:peptidoglycan hydrolase-like protein with peptidoglycan-binding domain